MLCMHVEDGPAMMEMDIVSIMKDTEIASIYPFNNQFEYVEVM